MRLLGSAQEGGSTVSECFLSASRIDPNDEESWYREWKRTADTNAERGRAASASGNFLTAQNNWLRAINYYGAAAFNLDDSDDRRRDVLVMERACAQHYLELQTPAGEIVEIPWRDDCSLEGYLFHAQITRAKSPVVICIAEPGRRKEEFLYKTVRHALSRGISLLAVDLLGSAVDSKFAQIDDSACLEVAVNVLIDYLTTREDVDDTRIVIISEGACSSFVTRAAAHDHRLAAVVCDGGIWDLHEIPSRALRAAPARPTNNARNLRCPVLITIGEHGWLDTSSVLQLFDQLRTNETDISLRIFEATETAASQGHVDNPTLANEYIFDWIAGRLANNCVLRAEPRLSDPKRVMGGDAS